MGVRLYIERMELKPNFWKYPLNVWFHEPFVYTNTEDAYDRARMLTCDERKVRVRNFRGQFRPSMFQTKP